MKKQLAAFLRRWADGLDPRPKVDPLAGAATKLDALESQLDRIWASWLACALPLDGLEFINERPIDGKRVDKLAGKIARKHTGQAKRAKAKDAGGIDITRLERNARPGIVNAKKVRTKK